MANTADISRGLIIKLDGSLYSVVDFGENKTARAAAKVWAKLKGVDNNRSIRKPGTAVTISIPFGWRERIINFFTKTIRDIISWTRNPLNRLRYRKIWWTLLSF